MNDSKSSLIHFFLFCTVFLITTQIAAQHFTTIKSDEGIEIQENGKKVLFYQIRPKSVDGKYARAGYIHPLYSLNGNSLTDDMPEDHPYHHGIFWAWHQIIVKNKPIADGWTSENISWNPVKVEVFHQQKKEVLHATVLWKTGGKNSDSATIIRENTAIQIHPSTSQYRIIDFDIQLFPLVDSLKLGGSDDAKGYGGFCLRLKLPEDISFVSQDSILTPQETAVMAGPWMDMTGSFGGTSFPKSGILVFANPSGSNQPWILRKAGSMQNMPFPGRTPVPLTQKGWQLTYRVIVHNGTMSKEDIQKLYMEYKKEVYQALLKNSR